MSSQSPYAYDGGRPRQSSRRPPPHDEYSFSDSDSLAEKHRSPPPHTDPRRRSRREPSRHHRPDDGAADGLGDDRYAVVRREEILAVQHIPRSPSVASSASGRTYIYDSRGRRQRHPDDTDDGRSRRGGGNSDRGGRRPEERRGFDPRVIFAALLFCVTAVLCFKEVDGGGKKRAGRQQPRGGRRPG